MKSKKIIIEVCATSIMSAMAAERGGAQRIELCDNIIEGGTTPSAATISMAHEKLSLDVCVLIRPRGGDFLYNDVEFEIMKKDIIIAKELGADGIVTGILNMDGLVDMQRMKEIIEIARPMEVAFHRAFDMCSKPKEVLNQLINLKVDRLLTSGQKNSAIEGVDLIAELIQQAKGRIDIMPGAGVNLENFLELRNKSGASSFHLTGRKLVNGNMRYKQTNVVLNDFNHESDFAWLETNSNIIKGIVELSKT